MKLAELMTRNVETCSPSDTLVHAAKVMKNLNIGAVPITEGDKLVGMLTDRDIVLNCVAKNGDCNKTTCSDCMTSDVITGTPEMSANDAASLMADRQIRRLPVMEGNRIVGIVSLGDLAIVSIHENEAGFALSEISEHTNDQMGAVH